MDSTGETNRRTPTPGPDYAHYVLYYPGRGRKRKTPRKSPKQNVRLFTVSSLSDLETLQKNYPPKFKNGFSEVDEQFKLASDGGPFDVCDERRMAYLPDLHLTQNIESCYREIQQKQVYVLRSGYSNARHENSGYGGIVVRDEPNLQLNNIVKLSDHVMVAERSSNVQGNNASSTECSQTEDAHVPGCTRIYEKDDGDIGTLQYFPSDVYIENDIEVETRSEYEITNTITSEGEVQKIGEEVVNEDFMEDLKKFVSEELDGSFQLKDQDFDILDDVKTEKIIADFEMKADVRDPLATDSAVRGNVNLLNSPVSPLPAFGSPGILENRRDKEHDINKAAKSLFSKRTRTLYHWMFPNVPKNKLKDTISDAWDKLSDEEKQFYRSQVLGRFGLRSSNPMVNPQLDAIAEKSRAAAMVKQSVLETQNAVKGLYDASENSEDWASRDVSNFSDETETAVRSLFDTFDESEFLTSGNSFSRENCPKYSQEEEEERKQSRVNTASRLVNDYSMFQDDYELSSEIDKFNQYSYQPD